ncbi:D-glycerate dehydrogenase [Alicyclobacillus sp. TC]|nr:D-glycerate dehydrogenase [Alicyclobacillus sp. TC]
MGEFAVRKAKVYVPDTVAVEAIDILRQDFEVVYTPKENAVTPLSELLERLQDVDGLLVYPRVPIDKNLLDQAPNLRVVSNIAVGYDNFDLSEMAKQKVVGTHTPDVLTETTADLAFGLLLAAARRIPEANAFVKSGQWHANVPNLLAGTDVYGRIIGIVGMGRIGTAVARRALGFGMRVLYYNRRRRSDIENTMHVHYVHLDHLLQTSDFVVVLTPLTEETVHLIGRSQLEQMKPDAYLINVARGKVVDEQALIFALQNGWIRGAGLDVYENEPLPSNHPFLHMNQVVTLPHIGSSTVETRKAMALLAAENLRCALLGEKPPHMVNPEVWDGK